MASRRRGRRSRPTLPVGRCESCGWKVIWRSEDRARAAIERVRTERVIFGDWRRRESRAYQCPEGNGWHLTSQPDPPAA